MHALPLDETSEAPNLDAVLHTADFYRLSAESARGLLDELRTVTRERKKRAKALKLPSTELSAVEGAFTLSA
jgi:hypothetical protein